MDEMMKRVTRELHRCVVCRIGTTACVVCNDGKKRCLDCYGKFVVADNAIVYTKQPEPIKHVIRPTYPTKSR